MSGALPVTDGIVGGLIGLQAASRGAFLHAPPVGFLARWFLGNVGLALAAAYGLATLLGVTDALVLAGVVAYVARGSTGWRTLASSSGPLRGAVRRDTVGVPAFVVLIGVGLLVHRYQDALAGLPSGALVILGGAGGWLAACGTWHPHFVDDPPLLRLWGTPVATFAWSGLLVPFTTDLALLAAAAAGWAVLTLDTFTTFLADQAPAPHRDESSTHAAVAIRRTCRWVHGGAYAALALVLVLVVTRIASRGSVSRLDQVLAGVQAALVCLGCATVALWTRDRDRRSPS